MEIDACPIDTKKRLPGIPESPGQAEVCQFETAILCDENVGRFHVSVKDLVTENRKNIYIQVYRQAATDRRPSKIRRLKN